MNRDALKDLCLRYLDGDLVGQEAESFSRLIAGSEDAARLLARMAIHDSRFETSAALVLTAEDEQGKFDRLIDDALRSKPVQPQALGGKDIAKLLGFALIKAAETKQAKWLYSAAATVLLAFVVWQVWGPDTSPRNQVTPPSIAHENQAAPASPASPVVATLTAGYNATWATPAGITAPANGESLRSGQRLTLTAGFAEITTNDGAVVILEAPATVELLDNNNALHLHTGKLVGRCETRLSQGFTILTEHARIVDLGTVFGVELSQGTTRTTVFEGKVAVAAADPESTEAEPIYLTDGQSAKVDHLARVERFTPAPQSRFVLQWKDVAQPPHVAGQIEYRSALPASLASGVSESNQIQLYPEATGVRIDSDFRVTITEPGKHETFAAEDAQPIGATLVDAYLIHYDFKHGEGDAHTPRHATIRFDRPILGVIADERLLFASDHLFAPVGMDFGPLVNPGDPDRPTGRGLEPKLSLPGDIVEISEDRKTLSVELYGAMAVDQLRILVQSPESIVQ